MKLPEAPPPRGPRRVFTRTTLGATRSTASASSSEILLSIPVLWFDVACDILPSLEPPFAGCCSQPYYKPVYGHFRGGAYAKGAAFGLAEMGASPLPPVDKP